MGSLIAESWGRYKTIRQDGAWAGFRSDVVRIPEQHLSVICLCNRSDVDPTAMSRRIARLFLTDLPATSAQHSPLHEPEKVLRAAVPKLANGSYYSPELETIYHVKLTAHGLLLQWGHLEDELKSIPGGSRFANE